MIRHARYKDYDRIMEMMVNFANSAPVEDLHNPEYDYRRIQNVLMNLQLKGCVLLATDELDVAQGMLIAVMQEDLWLPHVKALKEVAWWVEPEYRNTTMGYRLLREYVKFGNELKDKGLIHNFTLTNMKISPDFDLEKRGWREVETNYVYEG